MRRFTSPRRTTVHQTAPGGHAPDRTDLPRSRARRQGPGIFVLALWSFALLSAAAAQLPPPPPLPGKESADCPTCGGRLKKRVAVMPVEIGGLAAGLALPGATVQSMASAALEARLAPMPGLLVVSRSELSDIVAEQRLAQSSRFNEELGPRQRQLIPAQVLLYLTVESLGFHRTSSENVTTDADRRLQEAEALERQAAAARRQTALQSSRLRRGSSAPPETLPGVDCAARYDCSAYTTPAEIKWCNQLRSQCEAGNQQRAQIYEMDRDRAFENEVRMIEESQLDTGALEDRAARLRSEAARAETTISKEVHRTAILQMSWRAIDTSTGQILASGTVAKSGSQNNRTQAMRAGLESSQQSELRATELLVKSVLDAAMLEVAGDIDRTVSKEPFRAKVVQVDGDTVILNAGTNLGVTRGDTFGVLDPETALTDPVTGEYLSAPGEPAGLIVVDRVAEKVAFAKIVEQVVALRRGGDLVWLGRR